MEKKRSWGKTVASWFVVDSEPGSPQAAQPDAGMPSGEAAAPAPSEPLPPIVNGTLDLAAIYGGAGVDAGAQDRVVKAQALLRSLPAETPEPVKRQIVETSLRTFGVPTDEILRAAAAEIQALEAYVQAGEAGARRTAEDGNARIAELEAEMGRVRQAMEQAAVEQEGRARAASQEKLNVQQVLDFFGEEAVARAVSRLANPG